MSNNKNNNKNNDSTVFVRTEDDKNSIKVAPDPFINKEEYKKSTVKNQKN